MRPLSLFDSRFLQFEHLFADHIRENSCTNLCYHLKQCGKRLWQIVAFLGADTMQWTQKKRTNVTVQSLLKFVKESVRAFRGVGAHCKAKELNLCCLNEQCSLLSYTAKTMCVQLPTCAVIDLTWVSVEIRRWQSKSMPTK